MATIAPRRRVPLFVVAATFALAALAVSRLPDIFLATLARGSPLTAGQADWAVRLLLVVACAQAAYGAVARLRRDAVARAVSTDRELAAMPADRLVGLITRTAALMVGLTLVYGVAALWVSGRRAAFWAFALVAVAQFAWYYRQTGELARWVATRPVEPDVGPTPWRLYDADYSPPLARELAPLDPDERT